MLKVGSKIPHFRLLNQHGKPFDSHTLIGKKPCVIYFYPKNFTPGCTAQSCGFRDHYKDFQRHGVQVVGISSDSVKRHKTFASIFDLPFVLLSDPQQVVQKMFGIKTQFLGLLSQRITYVINKEGVLVKVYESQLVKGHIQATLKALKTL